MPPLALIPSFPGLTGDPDVGTYQRVAELLEGIKLHGLFTVIFPVVVVEVPSKGRGQEIDQRHADHHQQVEDVKGQHATNGWNQI